MYLHLFFLLSLFFSQFKNLFKKNRSKLLCRMQHLLRFHYYRNKENKENIVFIVDFYNKKKRKQKEEEGEQNKIDKIRNSLSKPFEVSL